MRKVRKKSTEITSQKPAEPPELKSIDPTRAEEPGETHIPPGQYRGYVAALLVWAIAFAFLVGLLLFEGIAGLFIMLRNALGL
jgi:hypothetical protein